MWLLISLTVPVTSPVRSPVTLPVTLPINGPVIPAKVTLSPVPTLCPISIVNVSVATVVATPIPPVNVNVSVSRLIVSVPVSPAIGKSLLTVAVPAAVILPCWSTVMVGICVPLPYEPAVTAVLSKSNVTVSFVTVLVSPGPPPSVNVSVSKMNVTEPQSPAIGKSLLTATTLADVILPFPSIIILGISVVLP